MEELAMKDKTDTEIYQELRDYFQTVLKACSCLFVFVFV